MQCSSIAWLYNKTPPGPSTHPNISSAHPTPGVARFNAMDMVGVGSAMPTYTPQQLTNGAQGTRPPPTPYKHWENWNYCHCTKGTLKIITPMQRSDPHQHKGWLDGRYAQKNPTLHQRTHPAPNASGRCHARQSRRLVNSLCHPLASIT
jgi:hypothetical protein